MSTQTRCLFTAVLLLSLSEFVSGQEALELGRSIERELKGGEKHRFALDAGADHFTHIVATQKGIDLVIRLLNNDGTQIHEIDSPNGSNRPEPIWHIFERDGAFVVEIESLEKDAKPGKYELKLNELRPATADDRYLMRAKMTILAASKLGNLSAPPVRSKALPMFREAAAEFEKIGADKLKQASGFEQVGRLFGVAGEKETALEYYDRAIKIYLDEGQKPQALNAMKAGQNWTLGIADGIERNDAIRKLSLSIGDRKTEAMAHREIAFNFYNAGAFTKALQASHRSLAIAEQIDERSLIEANYNNLGAIYTAQGNLSAALAAQLRAISMQTEGGKKSNPGTILNLGNIYHGLGNYELALHNFEMARSEFEMRRADLGQAYAVSNMGSVYLDSGEYDKALEYFLKAQPMKAKFMPNDPTSFHNIASVYSSKGQFVKALEYADQAVELVKKTGDNDGLVRAYLVTADIYQNSRDYERSLASLAEAISLSRKFEYKQHLWSALTATANAQLQMGRRTDARRSLDEAASIVDSLQDSFAGPEERSAQFFDKTDSPLRLLIRMNIEDGRPEKALPLAETMKARALVNVLKSGRVSVTSAMTEAEKEREAWLKLQLASLNKRKAAETDPTKAAKIAADLTKTRLELEDFRTGLYGLHPELQARRGELLVSELKTPDFGLATNSIAIVFVSDEEGYFGLIVSGKGAPVASYPVSSSRGEMEAKVERFRAKLAAGDLDFQKGSRELYSLLLKPAEVHLKGKTNIIIVPDGPLWDLPFQALMDEKGKYLIEKVAVSYAPSLTALREMSKGRKPRNAATGLELLAFGNPIVGEQTKERVQRVFMSEKLDPLPEAERLVNELGKMYGAGRSRVLTGLEAREAIAKSEAPKYRIVQFATHGILNNTSPMYSHLVLAQPKKESGEDGLLEAWELKDMNLSADMVILSACETARGKISRGEGMIGMTWAAFIAGAPTTVASQWKVESRSTTELMLEFHRQLLKGKVSKAEAMRQAALKLKRTKEFAHPSYWAGFVVLGDAN